MGEANATLDGRPLIGNVTWSVTSGVRPYTTIVTLRKSDAEALLDGGSLSGGAAVTGGGGSGARPVTLKLESGRSGEFKNLYVLHEMPAPAPAYAALLISDRRWLWQNCIYRRHLNVRRKIGTKRLVSQNNAEAWTVDDDVSFAPYSLKDGRTVWSPAELLADLGAALKHWEKTQGGSEPEVVIPQLPAVGSGGAAIQDLELDGTLDACIERALAFLPGMDVTVDADGSVRFFWRTGTEESDEIKAAGPEVMGRGHITPVSFRRVRPRKIRVYFSVMAEIRVDFEELASTGTTSALIQDGFWCENVLPVPDYALNTASGTVMSGTYVTFAEALPAWGALPGIGTLDFPKIRRAMVPFNNLWTGARLSGAASPAQDWMARIGAIQAHYRRTFRLNRRIMDRLASIHPYRVATINPVTGTRGRAAVFSDFSYVATTRSLFAEEQNSQQLSYAMNVACYPSGGNIAATTLAAPALLTIEDSDQGVFQVDYHADPTRVYELALPSQIETEGQNTAPGTVVPSVGGGPSPFLGRSSRSIGWNILGRFQAPATLTSQHKLIAIFTAVPASPNNKRAMCWVDVSPGEVPQWSGSNVCEGPMLEIRVGPGLEVARVGWDDTQKERIQSLLTSTDESPVAEGDEYGLKKLVINYDSGAGNSASLTSIARAAAARVWHALRDHSVGTATVGFRPSGKLTGSMKTIEHELDFAGALTSRMTVPAQVEAFDINRYLDASTQRIIHRLANPGE
jgi:hypothetical protein